MEEDRGLEGSEGPERDAEGREEISSQGRPSGRDSVPPAPEYDVREFVSSLTPVVRKVALNPKVLMLYDYMRSLGYGGDLGDFIVEAVEGYFKPCGIRIAVLRG